MEPGSSSGIKMWTLITLLQNHKKVMVIKLEQHVPNEEKMNYYVVQLSHLTGGIILELPFMFVTIRINSNTMKMLWKTTVLMGNANTTTVLGKGNAEVQFTSGKKLLLTNVLHVPEIRKNLVSAAILSKKGLNTVIKADKLIVIKW
ncbi:hypothetical protein Sango_1241300 [Sesamum angolense]|uniref:Retrovirus-related Pol polyprotein from transposon TNT 1-94-like beta-barrel domain-containing protein n=1 Tax=Sesamum angolense TaxID=2727404 RepID=A0AAE1WQ64_9LAMI|nr:hypothetical protein Sango_1241300 [Sesamum angolense]